MSGSGYRWPPPVLMSGSGSRWPTALMSGSGSRWPPVLFSVHECPHYEVIKFYFQTFPFEVDPALYPFADVLPLDVCLKFLKQVRNSWGYDVNVIVPHTYLVPVPKACILEEVGIFQTYKIGECKELVHQINNLAAEHGKFYEFVELKKSVHVPSYRYLLLTFTVREVPSGKLERVRVCYFGRDTDQWYFEDKDEDEDEDEDVFCAGNSSRSWK